MRRLLMAALLLLASLLAPATLEAQTTYKIVLTPLYVNSRCVYLSLPDCALRRFADSVASSSTTRVTAIDTPFEIYAARDGGTVIGSGTLRVNSFSIGERDDLESQVKKSTVWTFTFRDTRFELYNMLAHDVISVTERALTYFGTFDAFHRVVTERLGELRSDLFTARTEMIALTRDIAALESRAASLVSGSAPQACQPSAALQSELRDLQNETARRLGALQTAVGEMRSRLATCKTAADAEALRLAWAGAAPVGDEIDALARRAGELRQRMIQDVAAQGGRRNTELAVISGEAAKLRTDRIEKARRVPAPREIETLEEYLRIERDSTDSMPTDLANLKDPIARVAEPWVREIWASNVADARTAAARLHPKVQTAKETVAQHRLDADQLWKERDQIRADAAALERQLDALIGRIAAGACSSGFDMKLDDFDRARVNARLALDESDRIFSVSDRCVTGTPPSIPNPAPLLRDRDPRDSRDPRPQGPPITTTPRILTASLDCGGRLDIVAGSRPETCAIKVSGWNSATTEPVRVTLQPPFTSASGLRAAPGDTSQAGDTMYAAGTNDRFGEYVFGEGFSAVAGAPTGNTTIVIIVSQGDQEVRLPLTLGVRAPRTPTERTFDDPPTIESGVGGPYCVWQYRILGEPVGCWHTAVAGCTAPRYTGKPEYELIGRNMNLSQAQRRGQEVSRNYENACRMTTGGGYPPPPNVNRNPLNPTGTPRNMTAQLECGGRLEIEQGGRTETCGVLVRNWRSDTRTPVEIIFDPPFRPPLRVRVAPGDTSQGGDAMYAAGVNDRNNEYFFGEGFSADRDAPPSSTTFDVIVRQGNAEVRLPMTLNVVPQGTPKDSSFEPPTPVVPGSGGPYCVWQYRMFSDIEGCWNGVAAGCTEPRYAGRPEYVLVGENMTRSEADRRIGEISQFFDRVNCVPEAVRRQREIEEARKKALEEEKRRTEEKERLDEERRREEERRLEEERRREAERLEEEARKKVATALSRFGIDPRDITMKVGQEQTFRAWGSYVGSRDMIMEVPVKWSGDISPNYRARREHAGSKLRLTATAPDGSEDTIYVTVESVPRTAQDGTGGDTTTTPPTAGSVQKTKVDVGKDVEGRFGYTKYTETSIHDHDEEGPNNVQDFRCSFSGVPGSLVPGQVYPISATASVTSIPPTWPIFFEAVVNVGGGIEYVGTQTPAFATLDPNSKRPQTAGTYNIRLRPGATSGAIALSCYPGGTVATHHYGVK